MLVGQELLSFIEANEGCTEYELAEAAGYVKDVAGKSTVQIKAFTHALLDAKGVRILTKPKGGKVAPFKTAVHKSGIVLLGKTYSEQFNLKPGDELEIKLLEDGIKLVPTGRKVERNSACSI